MRGHLAAMRTGVCLGADCGKQHFKGRHPELQTQSTVTIVRVEPVVSWLQIQTCGNENSFVAGAADLKKDPVLAFKLDLLVIDASRHVHRFVHFNELLSLKSLIFASLKLGRHYLILLKTIINPMTGDENKAKENASLKRHHAPFSQRSRFQESCENLR